MSNNISRAILTFNVLGDLKAVLTRIRSLGFTSESDKVQDIYNGLLDESIEEGIDIDLANEIGFAPSGLECEQGPTDLKISEAFLYKTERDKKLWIAHGSFNNVPIELIVGKNPSKKPKPFNLVTI